MILLETDHASLLKFTSIERVLKHKTRLHTMSSDMVVGVTIITIGEQLRSWLATIARERMVRRQIAPYRELATLFDFYVDYKIVPFDDAAVDQFERLKADKLRIGTMDLKIAAIKPCCSPPTCVTFSKYPGFAWRTGLTRVSTHHAPTTPIF